MQRVHFIGIGTSSMQNLAIAVSKKNGFLVTGSDEDIQEPTYSLLKQHKLLPDKMGWFPDKLFKGITAVILGANVKADNPEHFRAKELGLKVYSVPEFLFQQTRSKTRIVVAGSVGKTFTTAVVLFVLKRLKMDTDYLVGCNRTDGNKVKLTYDSRIAVFEGDECSVSDIVVQPKFHFYKPHIGILTGIKHTPCADYPDSASYIQRFKTFADLMEVQGRLVYFEGDEQLCEIAKTLRRDIVPFPYTTPAYVVRDGITYLIVKKKEIPLKVSGEVNLQNITAARLACRQIGVTDDQFYSVISDFEPTVPNCC